MSDQDRISDNLHDDIGPWSEVKLDIVKSYAQEYSTILSKQERLSHVYVDAFASTGQHVQRSTGEMVAGSPLNALWVDPPFKEYHFVELSDRKIAALRELADERKNVHIYHGDCNSILLREIFPTIAYSDYRRGLCLLDPYGLQLHWTVVEAAAKSKSIEIFLNFPIMDIHRNVLTHDPSKAKPQKLAAMDQFWGDGSWKNIPPVQKDFFADRVTQRELVQAYRTRLKDAGFEYVPDPLLMKNSSGGPLYYLFFATHKPVAKKIVDYIFTKYRS